MCALMTDPTDDHLAAYIADCERHVIEILELLRLDNPNMIFTAAILAALRQLRTGRVAEAGQLIERITDRFAGLEAGGHWMFQLAIGWYAFETIGGWTPSITSALRPRLWAGVATRRWPPRAGQSWCRPRSGACSCFRCASKNAMILRRASCADGSW
jgi:hypothetical protein